ncbi:MAG: ferritin family protein [Candidatus Sedimenticola sp. (ex Thyasira tokunagai)]
MENPTEILKTILSHEVKASAFYALASEITHNDESRMLFIELADMEEGHAKAVADEVKDTPFSHGFDPYAYIEEQEANVETTLRKDVTEILVDGEMRDVLNMAISMEERAYRAYDAMAEKAEDPAIKTFCKVQAEEERGHKKMLVQLLTSLDMDEDERPDL